MARVTILDLGPQGLVILDVRLNMPELIGIWDPFQDTPFATSLQNTCKEVTSDRKQKRS